jgi:hypothetical protein
MVFQQAVLKLAKSNPEFRRALIAELKQADKWKTMPEGWTSESRKKFWESLTSRAPKHKVTECIKQMDGKVDDPGAFCGALADRVNPGWREKTAIELTFKRNDGKPTFDEWLKKKYQEVPNPLRDGRQDKISINTLLTYVREGRNEAISMVERLKKDYLKEVHKQEQKTFSVFASQLRQADAEVVEEESKPKSPGKGQASGTFIEFMKEVGDQKVTNPDTGNQAKVKSLKGPKGKELIKREFQKWLKKRDEKEKAKKKPSKQKTDSKKPKPTPKKAPPAKYFTSETEMLEFGKRCTPKREKWTPKQFKAVKLYTSSAFDDINRSLRGIPSQMHPNVSPQEIDTTVGELDSLFASPAGKLPESVKVTRGVNKDHPLVQLLQSGQLEPGMTVSDKGYQSTSLKEEKIWGEWKLEIDIPKGTEAIFVGPPPNSRGSDFSEFPEEQEVLLNRDTVLEVVEIDPNRNTFKVRVVKK